jgi:protein N-terminal amidase
MAWSTQHDHESYTEKPQEPDRQSLNYWLARLEPLIRGETEGEVIVVLANRCGSEDGTVYVGTSCILGINHGEINIYGILGRGEEKLLVVDTHASPDIKLEYSDVLEQLRNEFLRTTQPSTVEKDVESI